MRFRNLSTFVLALLACLTIVNFTSADPCGMIPPIYEGPGEPISRVGEQQTYVFFKDGVESFVIRPGFSGKVDQFGMLIPFPTPPSIRKIPDNIFGHIAAAVDPPEVVIDLSPRPNVRFFARSRSSTSGLRFKKKVAKDQVRVISQEAVGMYEVAVLEAGSAKALKRWIDDHGFRYPDGMDDVTNDYVKEGWCFVAVKTRVGQKQGVDPKPGQRKVNPNLPQGSSFDGFVQAMGFRFKTAELVVPMRLSAFNSGELRNVIYLLTDGPKKVRSIPEEYVMRQTPGSMLIDNLTNLLPLRIIGGSEKDLTPAHRQGLAARRNPEPRNGAAKQLFASDLFAVASGQLSLPQEEREKELLRIGESFGLRGSDVDKLNAADLKAESAKTVDSALKQLAKMTLTVVDGDFPREVLANQNLTFSTYKMPQHRNTPQNYDTRLKGPAPKKRGILKLGALNLPAAKPEDTKMAQRRRTATWLLPSVLFGSLSVGLFYFGRKNYRSKLLVGLIAAAITMGTSGIALADETDDLIKALATSKEAQSAKARLVKQAKSSDKERKTVVARLLETSKKSKEIAQRGWAIAALGEIGGQDVDEALLGIHSDAKQSMLVRTWAAAARVQMTKTMPGLIEKAVLVKQFPALGRPIGKRIVAELAGDEKISVEGLIKVTLQIPTLRGSLTPAILAQGADDLTKAMTTSDDNNVRRTAAGYLGTLVSRGDKGVPKAVINAYKFDPKTKDICWKGGALFLPGINWQRDDARKLVGQLIAWHLWCDRNGHKPEQKQIHNNLRSLALARAAGYKSPRFTEITTMQWLGIWGKAIGRKEMEKLLTAQGVDDSSKYSSVLKGLN